MPTYEYRCNACGHTLEAFQKISDPPKKKCPKCGKMQLERIISAGGGVLFKGPGFYATDYAKPRPPKTGEKGGAGKSGKSGGEDGSGSTDA